MIATLQGELVLKAADHVIVNVHGVGYQVWVSLETLCKLPDPKQEVFLNVYTHLRDDAILLYGFHSPLEKELFQHLIRVSGIGPKVAMNILSRIPADQLCSAIGSRDVSRLRSTPGVGKKTAERIVMELAEKLDRFVLGSRPGSAPPALSSTVEDAIAALVNLGYKRREVEAVIQETARELGEAAGLEELVRHALRALG